MFTRLDRLPNDPELGPVSFGVQSTVRRCVRHWVCGDTTPGCRDDGQADRPTSMGRGSGKAKISSDKSNSNSLGPLQQSMSLKQTPYMHIPNARNNIER